MTVSRILIASKKSLYSIHSSLLLLTLTLGDFLPVTSFADAGIATNDTVLMQPKTDTDTNTSEDPQSPEVPSVNVNG